jgi:hypothetical protein
MLIALTGFKGAGKTTAADYLVEKYNFECKSFATPIKKSLAMFLDITTEQLEEWKSNPNMRLQIADQSIYPPMVVHTLTFRQALQNWGKTAREMFGEDFWIDQLFPINRYIPIVIDDARYPNELHRIKKEGGFIVYVERPGYESDGHESEQEPPTYLTDFVIRNSRDVKYLHRQVEVILNDAV